MSDERDETPTGSDPDPVDTPSGTPILYWPQPPGPVGVVVEFQPKMPRSGDPVPPAIPPPAVLNAQARRDESRRQAYHLWLQNVPFREIGHMLGCSHTSARRRIDAYRQAIHQAGLRTADRKRDQLVAQHEANQRGLWSEAQDPTAPVIARVLARKELTRSLAEVGKLTGAYMPVKVASTTPDGQHWAPLAVTLLNQFTIEELKVLEKAAKLRLLAPPTVEGELVPAVTGA